MNSSLSLTNPLIYKGECFGPVTFTISEETFKKSLAHLNSSIVDKTSPVETETLPPSLLWGMARSLSATLGKLNEGIIIRSEWKLYEYVQPSSSLIAETTIVNVNKNKELPRLFTQTDTTTLGKVVFSAFDELGLLHDAKDFYYREPNHNGVVLPVPLCTIKRRLGMRYKWSLDIWEKNIHTDKYAQKLGYKSALPEYTTFMDWIFALVLKFSAAEHPPGMSILIQKILPMYIGDEIETRLEEGMAGSYVVRFIHNGTERLKGRVSFNGS